MESTSELAQWLKKNNRTSAVPPNAPPPTTAPYYPKGASVKIEISIGGPDRTILWWGADPLPIGSPIKCAVEAYNRYMNMGITQVRGGIAQIICLCPRPYREQGRVWPPHLHFVNPYQNRKQWRKRVFAIAAFPGHHQMNSVQYTMSCIDIGNKLCSILTPQQVKANLNKLIVVSALPFSIPPITLPKGHRVLHIPHDSTETEIEKAAKQIGDQSYVAYCMHSKCGAASHLIERFMKARSGAKNVYYMPLGQRGWNRMIKK